MYIVSRPHPRRWGLRGRNETRLLFPDLHPGLLEAYSCLLVSLTKTRQYIACMLISVESLFLLSSLLKMVLCVHWKTPRVTSVHVAIWWLSQLCQCLVLEGNHQQPCMISLVGRTATRQSRREVGMLLMRSQELVVGLYF